jgi:hypothetical protein
LKINSALKRKAGASLTVEAALVLPIFIYAIAAFIYLIQIFFLQEYLQKGITETGYYCTKYAYVYNYLLNYDESQNKEEEEGSSDIEAGIDTVIAHSIDSVFYKIKLQDYVNVDKVNQFCIKNGYFGINTILSSYMEEDEVVDIVLSYDIKLPLLFIKLDNMQMIQRVRMRGWSGHKVPPKITPGEESEDKDGDEKDGQTVYITENGTVYHLTKECSHLKLSIQKVAFSMIDSLRNESGGKYKKCAVCGGNQKPSNQDSVYITDEGDCYHKSLDCSGLKRTIIEVLLSEVGSRRPCQRCGK